MPARKRTLIHKHVVEISIYRKTTIHPVPFLFPAEVFPARAKRYQRAHIHAGESPDALMGTSEKSPPTHGQVA